MSYRFYLDKIMLPIAPASVDIRYSSKLKRVNLACGDEVVFPEVRELAEIGFTALLPRTRYPFAVYMDAFRHGSKIFRGLLDLKESAKPFRFIINRNLVNPDSPDAMTKMTPGVNMKVLFKELRSREDAAEGSDIYIDVKLVEYRDYAVKRVATSVVFAGTAAPQTVRPVDTQPSVKTYKVVKGDCLWSIAQRFLGNGNRYKEIYNLNKAVIDAGNKGTGNPVYTIYTGQEFILP